MLLRRSVAILLFTCCQCFVAFSQTNLSARSIIERMVAEYKHATSYQDSGTVSVLRAEPQVANHSQAAPFSGTLVSFRTYFVKPDLFRFDWTQQKSLRESSVWFDGKDIYQWMPLMGGRSQAFE